MGMNKRLSALSIALVLALSACGEASTEAPGAPGGPETSSTSTDPHAVQAVYENVSYYGACGNEVLHHDSLTLYPLHDDEEIDVTSYSAGSGLPFYGFGMGLRVPAISEPGPGDDVGTLTLYADGYARFVSDSGTEIWLTQEQRDYNWVC